MSSSGPPNDAIDGRATTGLPLFRTWPRVYAFVATVFVAYVVLLTVLTRAFR